MPKCGGCTKFKWHIGSHDSGTCSVTKLNPTTNARNECMFPPHRIKCTCGLPESYHCCPVYADGFCGYDEVSEFVAVKGA